MHVPWVSGESFQTRSDTGQSLVEIFVNTHPADNLSNVKEAALSRQVQKPIINSWVVPSELRYGTPVLFVPKRDRTLKICIGYRPLSSAARK